MNKFLKLSVKLKENLRKYIKKILKNFLGILESRHYDYKQGRKTGKRHLALQNYMKGNTDSVLPAIN